MEAFFIWLAATGWLDIIIGWFLKCGLFITSYIAMRIVLRFLDRLIGIKFSAWVDGSSSRDKAIYFGFRFLGTAIMAALIFS